MLWLTATLGDPGCIVQQRSPHAPGACLVNGTQEASKTKNRVLPCWKVRQALVSADMCLGHSSEARESQYLPGHGKRIWPHANAHLTPSRARLSGPIQRAGSNAGDRPTDGVGLTARGRAPSPPKKALAAEAAATEAGDRFGVPGSHVADRGLSINERGARAPRAEA